MTTTHTAIRVDMDNNAEEFWGDLRETMPHVAASLERNSCAVVSLDVLMRLDLLGAFNGQPSPLIDCGAEGDMFADVVGGRHEVIDA